MKQLESWIFVSDDGVAIVEIRESPWMIGWLDVNYYNDNFIKDNYYTRVDNVFEERVKAIDYIAEYEKEN